MMAYVDELVQKALTQQFCAADTPRTHDGMTVQMRLIFPCISNKRSVASWQGLIKRDVRDQEEEDSRRLHEGDVVSFEKYPS